MSFELDYFDGGPYDLYIDFPVHWITVQEVLKRTPSSFMDIGGARGYIAKHVEEVLGIRSRNLDISTWCFSNRVTNDFILWNATITPWPVADKSIDLALSMAFLEHLDPRKVRKVVDEIVRVSNRSLHGVTFEIPENDIDPTHTCMKPKSWWKDMFANSDLNYEVEIVDKEDLERGNIIESIPPSRYPGIKLNLGSFLDQFHYGWINVDILPLHKAALQLGTKFRQYDITRKIREEDNVVECIVASHVLEHLTRDQGINLLKEALRVLKPGGTLRIATPDLRGISKKYIAGSIKDYGVFNKTVRDSPDDALSFFEVTMAGHKTVYDETALIRMMIDAGFSKPKTTPFNGSDSEIIRNETFDLHPELSIYIEGVKP